MASYKRKLLKVIAKKSMSNSFYIESCELFEIVNNVKAIGDEKLLTNEAIKILGDIAYTFFLNLDFESLLNTYPMQLENHMHFYLINEMYRDESKKELLRREFSKNYIENNEWTMSQWNKLVNLRNYCLGLEKYPNKLEEIDIIDYLSNYKNKYNSTFQQIWLDFLIEEYKYE